MVDVGCGSGVPITQVLVSEGLSVSGIDASPTLMAAFRQRFPTSPWACEPVESSSFFDQIFDAAIAVGLLFLLPTEEQRRVIQRISEHVRPSGRFLFSAPRQACSWADALTGLPSASLGADAYGSILREGGFLIESGEVDEGGNHYFDAVRGTH